MYLPHKDGQTLLFPLWSLNETLAESEARHQNHHWSFPMCLILIKYKVTFKNSWWKLLTVGPALADTGPSYDLKQSTYWNLFWKLFPLGGLLIKKSLLPPGCKDCKGAQDLVTEVQTRFQPLLILFTWDLCPVYGLHVNI